MKQGLISAFKEVIDEMLLAKVELDRDEKIT